MGKIINLFCIPHAGGTANYYLFLQRELGSSVRVIPIELAGRGGRFNEPLYESILEAVEDIYNTIKNNLNDPYAIFGHSMGSLLAFELCHKIINESNRNRPLHVFFSGASAPHIPREKTNVWNLPDEDFIREIMKLGGTPGEFLGNDQLKSLFLPVIRSDYAITSKYQCTRQNPLDLDFTVVFGRQDLQINDVLAWNQHTSRTCRIFPVQGGHFYFNESNSACDLFSQILMGQLV